MDKKNIANQNRKRGKRVQKRAVEEMGARNIGIMGGEDGEHPQFSIEVKSTKRCVIEKWMEQAEKNTPPGKISLLRVHIVNKQYKDDFIIVRANDFTRIT